ncbi:hypothetical protein [Methyloglobulus sp.]|uniref:hypothetical protein n=1 Tax=Methyloglobulus sp. TaxID=2518622 RepID=UPI00398A13A8
MQSWISATSMDGGSAEEDMESSPPIPAEMTSCVDAYALGERKFLEVPLNGKLECTSNP